MNLGPLSDLRVLIVHDWLVSWAGAERCLEQIVNVFPRADVVVGVKAQRIRDLNEVTTKARETWLHRVPGARRHHRWFLPLEALAFLTLRSRHYDLIVSSSHAFSKMVQARRGALHVCYCHSPPRYLWDLRDEYFGYATWAERIALAAATSSMRFIDRWSAQRVHHFIANSRFVAERIRRWYGREADVVYPPVSREPDGPIGPRGDFLLYLGRLVPYKRVDLAIGAANRIGLKLVVAGDGPDRGRLEALGEGKVEFTGEVTDAEASRLLGTCAAFLFCAEEDFGIAPLEANAHGAPVVGYARGGLLESMIPGVTAEFFEEQTVTSVVSALRRALNRTWDAERISVNAKRFAPPLFRDMFIKSVTKAWMRHIDSGGSSTR